MTPHNPESQEDSPAAKAAGAKNRRLPGKPAREGQPPPRTGGSVMTAVGALVGILVGAGAVAMIGGGSCSGRSGGAARGSSTAEAGAADSSSASPSVADIPAAPDDRDEPEVAEPDVPKPEDKPWTGPWLGAVAQSTPVYPTARFSRNRIGYLRRGAKVAVIDKPIRSDACKQGFYPLVDGGFVCGKYATVDVEDARVKLGVRPPDLEASLPYKYAFNTAHGTPLYVEVPAREAMLVYEPYLKKTKKKGKDDAETAIDKADQPRLDTPPAANAPAADGAPPAGAAAPPAEAPAPSAPPPDEEEKPWWQRDTKNKPLDIKLSDLDESDGTLAKRMVKGFFVAIDRTFSWNGRTWYKTTEGLVAPSDRMVIPKTPDLKGFVMSGGVKQVGFVRSTQASKYERKKDGKGFARKGGATRFTSFALSGASESEGKERFYETTEGWWMREAESAITEPGPRPDRIGADEKWVDVNLTRKTLVAMQGDTPVYAALISPGKSSPVKSKDHRTKTGIFRIREKHIATTMDGDGAVGGELPYSIMDVPYVEYYDGSYALHAAFWHNNFGREQSHGCVNLAPNDAKWLFFWTEPALPRGWHGVWASDKRKGSWVVVHE